MQQKRKVWWKCLVGGAAKWKHGVVLTQSFDQFSLSAEIVERENGTFTMELRWDSENMSFAEVLQHVGKVPLPPYLHREAETSDEERYQTIFASEEGSVAAPTAGLHFTPEIMLQLQSKEIPTDFVTLHVGAGTFKPIQSEHMETHEMHAEWIEVPVETIAHLIRHVDQGIIAVGTTALRTLESLYWIGIKLLQHKVPDFNQIALTQWEPYELNHNDISTARALQAVADWLLQHRKKKLVTRTQILIAPGYDFKVIKGLITNFHQPQSTLLLLIAALTGEEWKNIYRYALDNDFRFLSYGDGSLLWRNIS